MFKYIIFNYSLTFLFLLNIFFSFQISFDVIWLKKYVIIYFNVLVVISVKTRSIYWQPKVFNIFIIHLPPTCLHTTVYCVIGEFPSKGLLQERRTLRLDTSCTSVLCGASGMSLKYTDAIKAITRQLYNIENSI